MAADCSCRAGGYGLFRGDFLLSSGVEWLGALGIIAVDGYRLEPGLPRLNVGLHDVFDGGFFGHVDGLADRSGKKRLSGGHHFQVPAPRDGATTIGCQGAIEHRQMLGQETWSALQAAIAIDVVDDLGHLFRRVVETHQRLRNGVVDDLHHPAADQTLVLDQSEIGLDAGGVAVHHEADGAGGCEHGNLGIFVAELFAVSQRIIPRTLRGIEQAKAERSRA